MKIRKTVPVTLKALPTDLVLVKNYRRRPSVWENAEVRTVTTGYDRKGNPGNSYYVILERRSTGRSRMFRDGGGPLFLTVGDDDIAFVSINRK